MKEMQLCVAIQCFVYLHPSYRLRFDTTDGERNEKVSNAYSRAG